MRFDVDQEKSRAVKLKHGLSLTEAQQIFDQTYIVDRRNDNPEQFRAIGWCGGRLCSVIFEIRHDAGGEYYRSTDPARQRRSDGGDVAVAR
jgi:uncharacterized DUF497 family protein